MNLLEALERDEGFRANPYLDTLDVLTFGYGRNLEANPLTGAEWRALHDAGEIAVSLSKEGGERLLRNGIAQAEIQCVTTFKWWSQLDETRRDVLTMLAFNLGMQRLMGFREMLAAISAGNYERAAAELRDSRWFTQVGNRGPRMVEQLRLGART